MKKSIDATVVGKADDTDLPALQQVFRDDFFIRGINSESNAWI